MLNHIHALHTNVLYKYANNDGENSLDVTADNLSAERE